MVDKADTEGLKDKIRSTSSEATFSVAKGMLCPYSEIEKSPSKTTKGFPDRDTLADTSIGIVDLDPETIGKIEERLNLVFIAETGETANVCLANSPEVRDEYKDTFNVKDLSDYIYAVLHSPEYRLQYKDLSKIDVIKVPYPNGQPHFWRLASLGVELRRLHLSESPSEKEHNNETSKTLNRIAEIETEPHP